MKSIGSSVVDRGSLSETIMDPSLAGKTVSIDVTRKTDCPVRTPEEQIVRRCRLDHRLRRVRARDNAGRSILPPLVRSMDRLVTAMSDPENKRVLRATLDYSNTRLEETGRQLEKICKHRNDRSALLVGAGHYNEDLFSADNFKSGKLSGQRPSQIGLSTSVMQKLKLQSGDVALLSRYPTTRVVPVEAVEIEDGSDSVVYFPVGKVMLGTETTSLTALLEGDLDGDMYCIRTVRTDKAKSELQDAFEGLWSDERRVPLEKATLTWLDHDAMPEEPEQIAKEKILQRTAIGSLTLDWYAVFIYLAQLKAGGVDTGLDYEDIRQMMTVSLESVFDLKHNNGSDPMALHALLIGTRRLEEVEDSLTAQGMDIEKIKQLLDLTRGQSIRELAEQSGAYAAEYAVDKLSATGRFLSSAPAYRPLEFIVALAAAKKTRSRLSTELVMLAARNAVPLAAHYRDALYPNLRLHV